MRDITAVMGIYMKTLEHLQRTVDFVERFNQQFPDIPLSISCVGSPKEYQDELKRLYGEEVTTGTTERVSFSETWNAAIVNTTTTKFVLIHNDMILDDEFFDQLEYNYLQDPKKFYIYTTIEPITNLGLPRPGKIVADFGFDVDDFKEKEFREFTKRYKETHKKEGRGYGFYISGYTVSLKDVGGFDFTTFYPIFCEDDDLMVRIRKKGYLLCTAPAAIVYHFGSKTTREIGAKGMSDSEVEQNRKFARKWGFEARYLWDTGYEFDDEILETGTEKIGYQTANGAGSPEEHLNMEPLTDEVSCDDPNFIEYLKQYGIEHKRGNHRNSGRSGRF